MENRDTIYDDYGIPTVINGAGMKTRIGGTLMREEVISAMVEASKAFTRISDLEAKASELISEVTGSEAGYVASGAAACLTLAASASISGMNPGKMADLPMTGEKPPEIVMPRTHRTSYDRAFRNAGARIREIGTNDRHLGTGSQDIELWEFNHAINERTVAVGYIEKPYVSPGLTNVIDIAHDNDVPVIVDAAAELPPKRNLTKFIAMGADMVVFSGGKAIRGPQSTGILAGKKRFITSAALQHLDTHAAADVWRPPSELIEPGSIEGVPRQGIGRPMKVGKEELVGLIRALELFIEEDQEAVRSDWQQRAEKIADDLRNHAAFNTRINDGRKSEFAPFVSVDVNEAKLDTTLIDLIRSLRSENPRVFVAADNLDESRFGVSPVCLSDDEANYLIERILAVANA